MTKKFNEFRFAGLNYNVFSNKYWTMNRTSEDGNKIVVKVADSHIFESKYGYGLILDAHHVLWLKDWQVSRNYYGNEVVLDRNYFNVKEWGDFSDNFADEPETCDWIWWARAAAEQAEAGTMVEWAR